MKREEPPRLSLPESQALVGKRIAIAYVTSATGRRGKVHRRSLRIEGVAEPIGGDYVGVGLRHPEGKFWYFVTGRLWDEIEILEEDRHAQARFG